MAPQAAPSDGQAWSGWPHRSCRSRRDLCRRCGSRRERARDRSQSYCRGSGGKDRARNWPYPTSTHHGCVGKQPYSLRQGGRGTRLRGPHRRWSGYSGLARAGYKHETVVISRGDELAHEVLPRVHMAASLLKRWLTGTHQGGVQHRHLDYYLDEFTFRFNRRHSKARGLLFHRLAQQALAVGPAPYRDIVEIEKPTKIG